MKTFVSTLVLAVALAGCASFGNTENPPVARDAGMMERPGVTHVAEAPGQPPLESGPSD